MMVAVLFLILNIPPVELREGFTVLRPHQGNGVGFRVHGGVQRCQSVVIAQLTVLHGALEFRLFVQASGDQPEIGRKEFHPRRLHRPAQLGHIHVDGERIPGWGHFRKIVEHLPPGPDVKIDWRKHFYTPPFPSTISVRGSMHNLRIADRSRYKKSEIYANSPLLLGMLMI